MGSNCLLVGHTVLFLWLVITSQLSETPGVLVPSQVSSSVHPVRGGVGCTIAQEADGSEEEFVVRSPRENNPRERTESPVETGVGDSEMTGRVL